MSLNSINWIWSCKFFCRQNLSDSKFHIEGEEMTTLDSSTTKQQQLIKKVYQAFFGPSRYEVKPTDREIIEWGNNYRIPFDGGELAVTTWGSSGPSVLLMHGWGGARVCLGRRSRLLAEIGQGSWLGRRSEQGRRSDWLRPQRSDRRRSLEDRPSIAQDGPRTTRASVRSRRPSSSDTCPR